MMAAMSQPANAAGAEPVETSAAPTAAPEAPAPQKTTAVRPTDAAQTAVLLKAVQKGDWTLHALPSKREAMPMSPIKTA
jgi:hypothetical protein